jgi:hypothetical protein
LSPVIATASRSAPIAATCQRQRPGSGSWTDG